MRVMLAIGGALMLWSTVAMLAACQTTTQSLVSQPADSRRARGEPGPRPLLKLDVKEAEGGYELLLGVTENGRVVGYGTTAISAASVHRNLMAHLSPERAEATSLVLAERVLERMRPILQRSVELGGKLIEKYPPCDSVPLAQRKGLSTLTFNTRVEFNSRFHPESSDKAREPGEHCVVLPAEGDPDANALMIQHMGMLKVILDLKAEMKNEFDFEHVRLWGPYGAATKGAEVVRPYYSGIARKAEADLAALGSLLRRATNGRDERAVVEAIGDVVQRLRVSEMDRVRPVFPSPSAVLVHGHGPIDAKATTIATLIRLTAPGIRMVLVEVGESFLLGVSVPSRDGEIVIDDVSQGGRRTFVVVDPWAPIALGRVVQPRAIAVSADGRITNAEMAMIYELTPDRN